MSTLRVSNIEAKADPSSPSVDEKLKVTNSNGDVLVHIDGKTVGVTTVGINTTDRTFTVDVAQNVEFLGIVTATKFSLSGGGEITGGDGNFTGIVTAGSGDYSGGLSVGTAVTAATANFTSSLTAASANFTGNVSIAGTLTYEDVTNVDSIGIATARSGIDVTGGHIDLVDNSKIRVGTGTDLQIFHDGNNSYIDDSGDGDLYVRSNRVRIGKYTGEDAALFDADGAISLYYDNSKKLETTTTGAKVTGALEVTQEYPSIRPTLDLNFAATKTLDRRITFTRDSLGTYVDELGIIRTVSNNTPRFDHDPTTGESLGLLIEESRTNRFVNSIPGTVWSKTNVGSVTTNTTTANYATAPDGTTTATRWQWNIGNTTSDRAILRQGTGSLGSSTLVTLSIYLKSNTGSNQLVALHADGGIYAASVVTVTPEWQRFRYTYTSAVGVNNGLEVKGGSGLTEQGDILVWGAQMEIGGFPTSYIPTSGSTVTRASDLAKITGTNFTGFYNSSEGTLMAHYDSTVDDNYISTFELSSSPSDNRIALVNFSAYQGFVRTGGTTQASLDNGTPTVGGTNKVVLAFKENDFTVSLNGATPVADASGTLPTVDTLMIGSRGGGAYDYLKSTIRKLTYYNKRLPNAQLQGLTAQ